MSPNSSAIYKNSLKVIARKTSIIMSVKKKIIAAGHFCIDMHPDLSATSNFQSQITPGNLIEVGSPTLCLGGVVGNTGIALYRLEQNVELLGVVGNDLFGKLCLDSIEAIDPLLKSGIVVKDGVDTSYSIVLESPGFDRCFLHCAGANASFSPEDIDLDEVASASLFHFGYPPLMVNFIRENGQGLCDMYRSIKERGVVTSMDMCMPDPASEGGKADWGVILKRVLPYVDIFLPSLDEICIILKRDIPKSDMELRELADYLIGLGVAMVGIKLGSDGMYMRSSSDKERIASCSKVLSDLAAWTGAEYLAACRETTVVSAKGAGDTTIAGFLAGLMEGFSPAESMLCATTVGACCVEHEEATEGIKSWAQITERMNAVEPRLAVSLKQSSVTVI